MEISRKLFIIEETHNIFYTFTFKNINNQDVRFIDLVRFKVLVMFPLVKLCADYKQRLFIDTYHCLTTDFIYFITILMFKKWYHFQVNKKPYLIKGKALKIYFYNIISY